MKMFAEREEDKKPQPLGIKISKILIFYLIIGFLGWNFFNFMFNSKFCNIEEVIIKGNSYLSENEIFVKSQIKLGKNIFKLDLNKVISSLKEEPWIGELKVKRVIPNKIIISLEERRAAAIIYIGEEYFNSSKEGIVLSKIDKTKRGFNLPLILGLKITEIKIGQKIDTTEFWTAFEIINSAEVILPKKFCIIKILAPDDFMICNEDDTLKVRVNKPEEIINKEKLLKEALEKIENEKLLVEYIDMSFKDSLIIKVKK